VYKFLRSCIPVVGVVVALLGLLGSTAAQAAGPAGRDLTSGAIQKPDVRAGSSDCQDAHLLVKTVSRVATAKAIKDGKLSGTTCKLTAPAGVGATTTLSRLAFCFETAASSDIERSNSCKTELYRYTLFVVLENGVREPIGFTDFSVNSVILLTGRSPRWTDNVKFIPMASGGTPQGSELVKLAKITVTHSCAVPGCVVPFSAAAIDQPFSTLTGRVTSTASFEPTPIAPNARVNMASQFDFFFTNPAAAEPTNRLTFDAITFHRCDNALGNIPPGCAFDDVMPIHEIQTGPENEEYAKHVRYAQEYGLTSILTRTTNDEIQRENAALACPSFIPRNGLDCDEYPFASTLEGAAKFKNFVGGVDAFRKTLRVQEGSRGEVTILLNCRITALLVPLRRVGDSSGFSVCLINPSHNASGGGSLLQFYIENRVIDQDRFRVIVR